MTILKFTGEIDMAFRRAAGISKPSILIAVGFYGHYRGECDEGFNSIQSIIICYVVQLLLEIFWKEEPEVSTQRFKEGRRLGRADVYS